MFRMHDVAGNITCRRCQGVGVLEHLSKFARWLHRRKRFHHALRRKIPVFQQPFHVLPRQARTGTNQVFHENLAGGLRISKPKFRK